MPKKHGDEVVPVLFRVWKPAHGHGVIAIFPTIPSDRRGYHCEMFEHVGQHGGGDPLGVIANTRPAKPGEYRDLKRELEGVPHRYKLHVVERMSSEMREACRAEARAQEARTGGGGARSSAAVARVKSDVKRLAAHAYDVKLRGNDGRWYQHDVVNLRPRAGRRVVEATLSQVGIYMPRGSDTLVWTASDRPSALIREYGNEPAVRLVPQR